MVCKDDTALSPKTKIRRLLVACPIELVTQFEITADWFETIDNANYLRLLVVGDKYTVVRDSKSDRSEYIDTLGVQVAPIVTARVGFDATIEEPEMDKLWLIEQIAYDCTTPNLRQHIPVTILDFVRPERGDRLTTPDGQEIYTVRTGRITALAESQGATGIGRKLYGGGFTLKFREQKKRRILG